MIIENLMIRLCYWETFKIQENCLKLKRNRSFLKFIKQKGLYVHRDKKKKNVS